MPINTVCPCGCQLRVSIALAGQLFKCPKCGQSIAIPIESAPNNRQRTWEENGEVDTHSADACAQGKNKEQTPTGAEAEPTVTRLWKYLGKLLGLLRPRTRPKKLRHGDRNPAGFVNVNQDGTVRELSPQEREFLAQEFLPNDSARPYIKSCYASLNGWGSISGFLRRSQVPSGLDIQEVNPDYDSLVCEDGLEGVLEMHREAGDIIKRNPDGSISVIANPDLSHEQRLENMRRVVSERQKEREKLAKQPKAT